MIQERWYAAGGGGGLSERGFIVPIGGAERKGEHAVILRRFVEICGGRGGRIAIIPTASQLEETGPNYEQEFLDLGAGKARSFPLEERADCERRDTLDQLSRADGVFFTGGNQLRLSTVLGGTRVAELLRARNLEGLHVGGTSAGAAVLSEHMIAHGQEGTVPRAGLAVLAPGLGILRRATIDQHFSQRNRLGRLLTALAYNPRIIGLGIDEDTAAFIGPDEHLEVVGSGCVTVVDPSEIDFSSMDEASAEEAISLFNVRLHVLSHGAIYDFKTRRPHAALARVAAR